MKRSFQKVPIFGLQGILLSLRRPFRLILVKKPTIFGPEDGSLAHSTFLFVREIERGGNYMIPKQKEVLLWGMAIVFFTAWTVLIGTTAFAGQKDGWLQASQAHHFAPVAQTGQTISYCPGDGGDLQMGISWPDLRFTNHGDGTVTDNLTNLMWTKDARLFLWATKEWSNAVSTCYDLSLAGHVDWRLPNVKELHSLVAYGNTDPGSMLPAGHPFVNLNAGHYWSSTTDPLYINGAYTVHFGNGEVTDWYKTPPSPILGDIWCVRGGN
ncbi:MAG: DUF1566 domain-containing protein [Thermodesulfobacteriota bacterium]|jgi:hypothetical protein